MISTSPPVDLSLRTACVFGGGTEWDASLSWAFAKKWTALAKLADYNANQYLVDTTKLWLSLEYVY